MGIKALFSVIKDECPGAYKEGDIKNQFGRKVAIVSICISLHYSPKTPTLHTNMKSRMRE